ncbi:ubiquinone biosynthesis protein COQ9 [Microaerobacter geothermalis]|uniref:hypothetical protein n=1 Tax=Microaerobacter geothermalis TaxID=674972 RepID=UPI001F22E8AC|nr:hypothetical protein [Microaerobacter geothermalis]
MLKNGGYRKYVEIHPIPLTHCSEKEMKNVYFGWREFLNTLETDIMLYIQSRQVDLDAVMKEQKENRIAMIKKYNAQGSVTEEFLIHQENFNLELMESRNLPVRRNFLIFLLNDHSFNFEKAEDFLTDRIEESFQYIHRFVRRYNVLKTPEVYDILHAWCNKTQSKYISGADMYEQGFLNLWVRGGNNFAVQG